MAAALIVGELPVPLSGERPRPCRAGPRRARAPTDRGPRHLARHDLDGDLARARRRGAAALGGRVVPRPSGLISRQPVLQPSCQVNSLVARSRRSEPLMKRSRPIAWPRVRRRGSGTIPSRPQVGEEATHSRGRVVPALPARIRLVQVGAPIAMDLCRRRSVQLAVVTFPKPPIVQDGDGRTPEGDIDVSLPERDRK